jgi:hypothetical protein
MICRKMEEYDGKRNLVFFGVKGVTKGEDGKLHSVFTDDKKSYADGIDGVNQSLTQRLSLIKGELYHFMNAGFPLLDKVTNKQVLDAHVITVVSHHSEVKSIDKIESKVLNRAYYCKLYFTTNYGSSYIEINRTI